MGRGLLFVSFLNLNNHHSINVKNIHSNEWALFLKDMCILVYFVSKTCINIMQNEQALLIEVMRICL